MSRRGLVHICINRMGVKNSGKINLWTLLKSNYFFFLVQQIHASSKLNSPYCERFKLSLGNTCQTMRVKIMNSSLLSERCYLWLVSKTFMQGHMVSSNWKVLALKMNFIFCCYFCTSRVFYPQIRKWWPFFYFCYFKCIAYFLINIMFITISVI